MTSPPPIPPPRLPAGEPLRIRACRWRGLPAWRIAGRRTEVVMTRLGGHLACIRRRGERLNPLWQPPWPACPPDRVPMPGPWGAWPKAPTNAAMVGSSPCLDVFGMPAAGDGRPMHGEAGTATWVLQATDAQRFAIAATLPIARLEVMRAIAIAGDAVTLSTCIRCQGVARRRIAYCEHTVLGEPFLAGARFAAAAGPARPPDGGDAVPLPRAFRVPAPEEAPLGQVLSLPVQPRHGRWAARNRKLGRTLEARWRTRDLPWLVLWSEFAATRLPPWSGRVRARGMEASATPFPGRAPTAACGLLVTAGAWRIIPIQFRWSSR